MPAIETEKTQTALILLDIECDSCGKSTRDKYDINFEYSHLTAFWGYGSKKDDTVWDLYFCEKCSDKILTHVNDVYDKIK